MADQIVNVNETFSFSEQASYPLHVFPDEPVSVVDDVFVWKGVFPYVFPFRLLTYRSHCYLTIPGSDLQERAG